MNINFLSRPVRRFLMDHLERLHDALEILGRRLRSSIAQLVGTQVGDAIREAIDGTWNLRRMQTSPERWRHEERWPDRRDYEEAYGPDGFWEEPEPELSQTFASTPTPMERTSAWKATLTTLTQLAGWWLQRSPKQLTLTKLLAFSAALGIATLVGGPVAGGVAVTMGTTILLTWMTDQMTSVVGRMGRRAAH